MQGFGHADVPVVLQVPGNEADALPCERLPEMEEETRHAHSYPYHRQRGRV